MSRARAGLSVWAELAIFACSSALFCTLAPIGEDAPTGETTAAQPTISLEHRRDRIDANYDEAIAEGGIDAIDWLERNSGRDAFVSHMRELGVEQIWYLSTVGDAEEQADTVVIALPEDPELRGPVLDAFWELSLKVNGLPPEQSVGLRYAGLWVPGSMGIF